MAKSRPSKRFGARYGSKIRENVDEAENTDAECSECGAEMEREAAGIWRCTGCGNKTAGGAYEKDTGAAETMKRALRVGSEELEEAKEEIEEEEA